MQDAVAGCGLPGSVRSAGSGLHSGLVLGCQVQEEQPALLTSRELQGTPVCQLVCLSERIWSHSLLFSKHCFARVNLCVNLLIRDK